MEIIDSDHAERLLEDFRAGVEFSDEDLDALTTYLTMNVIDDSDKAPDDPVRGRHLRLAIKWSRLLDEIYSNRPPSSLT